MAEICYSCGRSAYFYSPYLKYNLCKKHFQKMVIRRIRSGLIANGIKDKKFRFAADDSLGFKLNRLIFKEDKNSGTMLMNCLLEDFAMETITYFISGSVPAIKIKGKGYVSPLFLISEAEAIRFVESKSGNVGLVQRRAQDAVIFNLLTTVEKKRPGGLISLVKMGQRMEII